jgi:hypothetical protein
VSVVAIVYFSGYGHTEHETVARPNVGYDVHSIGSSRHSWFLWPGHEDAIEQHRIGPHVCSAGAYRDRCRRRCRTKPLHRLDLRSCPPLLLVFVLARSSRGTIACLAHRHDLLRHHVLRGDLNNDPSLGEPPQRHCSVHYRHHRRELGKLCFRNDDHCPRTWHRKKSDGCESGDPGVMQISSFCIDFGLGFGARYAKYAMYFKGRDEF